MTVPSIVIFFFYTKKSKATKLMWLNTTFHSVKMLHTGNGEEYIMLEL